MNQDFVDLLSAFTRAEVRFLLVGGYALAVHGYPRATRDMDVWIEPDPENAARALAGLADFGAPLGEVSEADLADDRTVVQLGVEPNRIDIVCGIDGISFPEAWPNRKVVQIAGLDVPVISAADLIRNKRSTGRLRDDADAQALEEIQGSIPF